MTDIKKFNGLNVSSKFSICGMPIRLDTYRTCSFGCQYCFANARKVMEFEKELRVANLSQIERTLQKVRTNTYNESDLLCSLIACGITWHCGGMSDPFQPCNDKLRVTNDVIDICNKHDVSILFSTKSDTVHGANIKPNLHGFQMSVSNVYDRKDIEPLVPDIKNRIAFFNSLKKDGFKVGIRIQPFIPSVTTIDILKTFECADHFTIEGIKIVPQNKDQIEWVSDTLKIPLSAFVNNGLFTLKAEYRREMYRPFIKWLKDNHKSYSVSDNDMRWEGNNICCCGDRLISKSSRIDTTAREMGVDYTKEETYQKCKNCTCYHLFTSNRVGFGKTVEDFYNHKTVSAKHPASKKFQASTSYQQELFPMQDTVCFLRDTNGGAASDDRSIE